MQIFMIGMPRSGTSILSEAISLHGDLGFLSNYNNRFPHSPRISFINRLAEVTFGNISLRGSKKQKEGGLALIQKYLPHSMESFTVWEHCCGREFSYDFLLHKVADPQTAERTRAYMGRVLKYQGKQRLFAKLTGPARAVYLRSIFPECHFVHVLRDPRSVIASLLSVDFWKSGGGLEKPWWDNGLTNKDLCDWQEAGGCPAALAAVQWRRVVATTDSEKMALGNIRFLELRYEDFVEQPVDTLRQLFKDLDLKNSDIALRYILTKGKLVNMNRKFRQRLTDEQVHIIEHLTRPVANTKRYTF